MHHACAGKYGTHSKKSLPAAQAYDATVKVTATGAAGEGDETPQVMMMARSFSPTLHHVRAHVRAHVRNRTAYFAPL